MKLFGKLSDAELVVLLYNGNEAAYTEIYNRYWALLYSHSRRMLRDNEEAMDVVQDVFAAFWTKPPELNNSGALKAYLFTAVRNATIKLINKSKHKDNYLTSLATFMQEGECATDNLVSYNEFVRQIEKEIAGLPPKMRRIFEMSRSLGLSHKQIANELNISDQSVKKTINRALKLLKTQFSLIFIYVLLKICRLF
ncbi:RNA polymerase sigma-70 factor, ECF subfamily [Mucilaginibacter gossypiicola]|uniref:RNA polymerase sigma-70 factor, ECF subfamily n=1 Tax=Mucilaginibacter gossypiicola TaxID=551995 RepID=A0A1H7ZU05_9SPHI|nr:RNA polymerase sigma-70 factor [Mucilaginibacter gossypiicola]SEM61930.1 RNA polymerase sigma-70 factor, ECF subfamily [Mucilaginibacter gossypiicola]